MDWLIPSVFCSINSSRGSFGRTTIVRTPSGPLWPFETASGAGVDSDGWYVVGVIGRSSSTDADVVAEVDTIRANFSESKLVPSEVGGM